VSNALTKANINLYAILRNIEDLCILDEEMKLLIQNTNLIIKFIVKNGPEGYLSFKKGKCSFETKKQKSNITLYFKSPNHFNEMIDGRANPILLKGLTKIKFLKNEFITLSDRLSYYLKPTKELLESPTYLKINTLLTVYTAFYALAQIGNTDPVGKLNAKRIPNGTINISVNNKAPAINLTIDNGNILVNKGLATNYRASMTFASITVANKILNGEVDTYSCLATEKLQMKGFIPMLDNMNKLLGQVPSYL
jgi:putative sterol carrier protein